MENTAIKEMMKQREEDNAEYYTDGKTVIRIKEHFPESGKTAAELIERTVHYESRIVDRQQNK